MHGIIFVSFADYLAARLEPEAAAKILDGEPAYVLSESYSDEQFVGLLSRAADATGMAEPELLRDFGAFTAEQTFARLYPAQFELAGGTRSFLLGIEPYIHELVRATMPTARPPQLTVREADRTASRSTITPRVGCALS